VKDRSRRDRNRIITDDSALKGIVSCLSVSSGGSDIVAAGSYTGAIGLYSHEQLQPIAIVPAQAFGVTHVQFGPNGSPLLFSGGRKCNDILGWDIRSLSMPVFTLARQSPSNQRIYFDIDATGTYLVTGSVDGSVLLVRNEYPTSTNGARHTDLTVVVHVVQHCAKCRALR
jgi:WD40 repeat protein